MKVNSLYLLALFALLLATACEDDEDINDGRIDTNDELFVQLQDALGGAESLAAARTLSYNVEGQAFEFQEDPEPVNELVSNYTYELTYNLDGSQSRQAWSVDAEYPYEVDFSFVERIDGTRGQSTGETGTFSTYFAGFGVMGDPMFSTKVAARRKTLAMASPITLVNYIAERGDLDGDDFGVISTGFNTSEFGFGAGTPDIMLVIDESTGLPTSARVLENDPLLGDVVYEVRYGNYTEVNGLQVPQSLEFYLADMLLRQETVSNISVSTTAANLSVSADEAFPYDAEQARNGHLSSQFHYRTLLQTFPIDFPTNLTESTQGVNSQPVPGDDDAYLVAGDFQSHYSFAFRVDDGLVIYDTPINDRRSATVREKVRADFSDLPITHVVVSHNHFDHSGGLRGALAEGGELVVGAGSEDLYAQVLQRESTVLPNPIAGRDVTITSVGDSLVIGTGDDRVILLPIRTFHAEEEDFLVLYKPGTQTIYFNDMVNPGFVFAFDGFNEADQARTIALAQDVVDFVDSNNLNVTTYHATHGFTTQDFMFATVRELASR